MRIFDPAILDLPFFDAQHKALAASLEEWVSANWLLQETDLALCPRERGKRYAALLGEAGWFKNMIGMTEEGRPDLRSICLIREAFAYLDDLVDFAFSIQSLSCAPIDWYGNATQKARYLVDARKGQQIGSFALSEPETGSNLANVTCQAKAMANGFQFDGCKRWIANADIADFTCVLARTGEGPGALGLSLFVVPLSSQAGIKRTPVNFIAPRACADITFDGYVANTDALIGDPGFGFKYAMDVLDFYRVSVGAAAIGFSRRARHLALQWCKNRPVQGGMLLQTQLTQAKLAEIDIQLHASALFVARAAWEYDKSTYGGLPRHAAMAKLYATEAAQRIVDESLQLLGAVGLTDEAVTSRLYRQVRSLRIYEGTSEIQKLIIAAGIKI